MSINNSDNNKDFDYPDLQSIKYNQEGRYSFEYLKNLPFDSFLKETEEVTVAYEKAKNSGYELEERDMWLVRSYDLVNFLNWKYNLGLLNPYVKLGVENGKLKMGYESSDENGRTDVKIIIDEQEASKTTRRLYFEGNDKRVGEVISQETLSLSNSWSTEDSFDEWRDALLNALYDGEEP